MTGHADDTQNLDAINLLLANGLFEGIPLIAEMLANAAMILSGMGPLDKLDSTAGFVFEGVYALVCGLLFFAVAGLVLAPMLHRLLHRFHLEDTAEEDASPHRR